MQKNSYIEIDIQMCFAKRNNIVGMVTKLALLLLHRQSNNLYLFLFP